MFSSFYNTKKKSHAFLGPDFMLWFLPKSILAETSIDDGITESREEESFLSSVSVGQFFSCIAHNICSCMSNWCLMGEKLLCSQMLNFFILAHKIWSSQRIMSGDVNSIEVLKRNILKCFILDFNPWWLHESLKPIKQSMQYLSKILKQNYTHSFLCALTMQSLY